MRLSAVCEKFLFFSTHPTIEHKAPFLPSVTLSHALQFFWLQLTMKFKSFSLLLALVKGENKRVNFYVIIKCIIGTRNFMLKALQQHLQQTHTANRTTWHNRWGYGKCFQFFRSSLNSCFNVDVRASMFLFLSCFFFFFQQRENNQNI